MSKDLGFCDHCDDVRNEGEICCGKTVKHISEYIPGRGFCRICDFSGYDPECPVCEEMRIPFFHLSVENGYLYSVNWFLENGANPNVSYDNNPLHTPLALALTETWYYTYSIIHLLLEKGANPNILGDDIFILNVFNYDPVKDSIAAKFHCIRAAKLLIDFGAKMGDDDIEGGRYPDEVIDYYKKKK